MQETNNQASAAPGMAGVPEAAGMPETPVETLSFREAMTELNGIVEALESNTLELEESLVRYERGIALLRYLKTSLADAQQKIDILMGELDTSINDETTDSTLSKA